VLPGEPGHDLDAVAATRRSELERSCELLGVGHLDLLGYRDSGMAGWPGNDRPEAFCNVPIDEAASALGALIERYQPQVVVTYDADGSYGHPDHIQTHRVVMAALDQSPVPAKLYFTARSRRSAERMAELRDQLRLPPRRRPAGLSDPPRPVLPGVSDDDITTVIDARAVSDRKRAALTAHASQLADTVWVQVSDADFADIFGRESFRRVRDSTGAALPEADLFAGL
jgi:LmbE family N-acetylglucosaminyl deacetylase